jgi:hypothetical protein
MQFNYLTRKTMKIIALAAAALFASSALATGSPSNNNGPRNGGNSTSNAAAISGSASSSKAEARAASAAKSSSRSKSSATGGNASAQGGTATASNGGNIVTISGPAGDGSQATHYSGGYEIKNTPDVFAPAALTTSPCRNGMSGGLSGSGFGLSFGGSGKDVACDLRQLAILYNGLGEKAKAVQVADGALALECGDADTAKALGNLCPEKKPEEKPAMAGGSLF